MALKDERDLRMLEGMSKDVLLELFALHIRNVWRVDGYYFLGVEEKFGTEAATEIDADCWRAMGKAEAKHLKKILGIDRVDPASFTYILRNTSWALDLIGKEYQVFEDKATFKVTECGTQQTRIRKNLGVFPCKKVRAGYLESFAEELDRRIETVCRHCPPDERPPGVWCEWEFRFPHGK